MYRVKKFTAIALILAVMLLMFSMMALATVPEVSDDGDDQINAEVGHMHEAEAAGSFITHCKYCWGENLQITIAVPKQYLALGNIVYILKDVHCYSCGKDYQDYEENFW